MKLASWPASIIHKSLMEETSKLSGCEVPWSIKNQSFVAVNDCEDYFVWQHRAVWMALEDVLADPHITYAIDPWLRSGGPR